MRPDAPPPRPGLQGRLSVLQDMWAALMLVDADCRIQAVTSAAERLLGLPA